MQSLTRPPLSRFRFRPTLEALETRDCPAAPTIAFTITPMDGRNIMISGSVQDEILHGNTVYFTGQYTGTVTTTRLGEFCTFVEANGLGAIVATVTDAESLTAQDTEQVTSNVPVISGFQAVCEASNCYTFSGYVTDEWTTGMTVNFGGVLAGQSTTVDSNGYFSLTVILPYGTSGLASAQTADVWGQLSDTVYTFVDVIE